MINILNRDYEVNKQSIYVTVRDVEDLNGNPMTSPVTWTAFVDRNALKWSEKQLVITCQDNADTDPENLVRIINNSGKRHQYTIESLPSWLTVDHSYGAIDPMGEEQVWLTFNSQAPVGEYDDIIYLTDEDGLAEPLHITYTVEAMPPYEQTDEGQYAFNMSICAQVIVDGTYDTDERDIVYAIYRNECVGQANVTFNANSNTTDVYLTVLGNDEMNRKQIHFQLWQASTGKIYDLTANRSVLFSHGFVYGCGENEPLILTTTGSERQQIELKPGWNWSSINLDLTESQGALSTCMTAAQPWTENDLIKNPSTRQFSTYDEANDAFIGTLNNLHHSQIYMIYTAKGNTMRVSGENLPEDSMKIQVRGDGQWSPLPCLFDQRTPLTEALADYYQKASVGDMIKSHNRFATFSADQRWVGDLTALQPGEGYLFRRLAPGTVEIAFYKQEANASPSRLTSPSSSTSFNNPKAATNMTMIAVIKDLTDLKDLNVLINDELCAVATPIDSLYFITIQSDQVGALRFELEGETLMPVTGTIDYAADSHHGSLQAPVMLKKAEETGVYKIIENDHVIIIRNNKRYDITGKQL